MCLLCRRVRRCRRQKRAPGEATDPTRSHIAALPRDGEKVWQASPEPPDACAQWRKKEGKRRREGAETGRCWQWRARAGGRRSEGKGNVSDAGAGVCAVSAAALAPRVAQGIPLAVGPHSGGGRLGSRALAAGPRGGRCTGAVWSRAFGGWAIHA